MPAVFLAYMGNVDLTCLCRPSWPYYRRLLRENIVSHREESDPERLKLMFDTATRDADWVVAKVSNDTFTSKLQKGCKPICSLLLANGNTSCCGMYTQHL